MSVSNSAAKFAGYLDRYERLDAEIAETRQMQRDLIAEMKSNGGYDKDDITAFRQIIADRKKDADKLARIAERKDILLHALGQLRGTPLADAAVGNA